MQTLSSPKRPLAAVLQTVVLGLLPWPAVWLGSYGLHSAAASFLFYHLLCILVWAWQRRPFDGKTVRPGQWAALSVAALVVAGTAYFAVGWLGWLINPAHIRAALARQQIGTSPLDYAALFSYFALVNPVAEELFWRRTIYLRFKNQGLAASQATLVSAALFASWHWLIVRLFFPALWAVAITLGIMAAGVIFAVVFERTRSMAFTILLHALAADVPVLLALWFGVLMKP